MVFGSQPQSGGLTQAVEILFFPLLCFSLQQGCIKLNSSCETSQEDNRGALCAPFLPPLKPPPLAPGYHQCPPHPIPPSSSPGGAGHPCICRDPVHSPVPFGVSGISGLLTMPATSLYNERSKARGRAGLGPTGRALSQAVRGLGAWGPRPVLPLVLLLSGPEKEAQVAARCVHLCDQSSKA